MKFKIFNEEVDAINLKLIMDEDTGSVDVVAVDDDGEPLEAGYICGITPSGSLKVYSGVNNELVEVDEDTDAIQIEKE